MKPIVEEALLDARKTRFGTVFESKVALANKRLGIGVFNRFIGGSDFSQGIQLAAVSVYHRYKRYLHLRYPLDTEHLDSANSTWSCFQDCPPRSSCQWGLCVCDHSCQKKGGRLNPEGTRCSKARDCNRHDINLVCRGTASGTRIMRGKCQCRQHMKWNEKAQECQLYLGVNCTRLNYEDPPSTNVAIAATEALRAIQGWATEDEKEERVRNLPRVKAMIEEAYDRLYSNRSLDEHFAEFEEDTFCPFDSATWAHGPGTTIFHLRWYRKYINRCKVSELLTDAFGKNISSVPSWGTQAPYQALEFSIWAPFSKFNMSLLSEEEMDEAFCRDVESFSPAYTPRIKIQGYSSGPNERPANCPSIPTRVCALLFDSWWLEILDGTQKSLSYWSSDYKYRNDADVVGVKKGCTFSAWTEVGFQGDKFELIARETERWTVFEKDPASAHFHENIESFQCNCF